MTDRYGVDPLNSPAQLAERLRRLEQQIAHLQGGPLVGVSAQALDENGDPLVVVGTLPDGRRGLLIVSAEHNFELTEMTTEGWFSPHVAGVSYDPNAAKTVVSGTFTFCWGVEFGEAMGPGVEVHIPWAVDAGSTGELLVSSNGGATTTAHAISGTGQSYARWLHDLTVGTGPLQLLVQARRTSGSGNVFVYQARAWVQHPEACSTAGTWV